MEAYIGDILVKSKQAHTHVNDLIEKLFLHFEIVLNESNSKKCVFGVKSNKFLGYQVIKRGVEANQGQIRALTKMPSPKIRKRSKDSQVG